MKCWRRGLACVALLLVVMLAGASICSAEFDWKRHKGKTVNVLLNKHPYTESLMALLPEFESLTGIKVNYSILPEEEYFEKLLIDLSTRSGQYDAFMTGPMLEWTYFPGGWLEPLDPLIKNKNITNPDYEFEDFFPNLVAANRWDGKHGFDHIGKGSLWGIPVMNETYILPVRKDWLKECGLTPPKTYPEMYNAAKKMTRTKDGKKYYGIITRGLRTHATIATGYLTGFLSCGARDFDEELNCTVNSPRGVEFTDVWMKAVKEGGPPDWTSITWYDGKERFAAGVFGMYPDCDFFAASYEDPGRSQVAGKVLYLQQPAGPDGTVKSALWTWALGMSSIAKDKEATWYFLQWATSKDVLKQATIKYGNMNPTRKSVWNDPKVQAYFSKWEGYSEAVGNNLFKGFAGIGWTPEPEQNAVGDRWALALHEIWLGKKTAKQALDDAARDINRIIQRAGLK